MARRQPARAEDARGGRDRHARESRVEGQGQVVRLGAAAARKRPGCARGCGSQRADSRGRVEHLGAKEALIQSEPEVFFTTPHFEGYPAVLIRLPAISREILEEV